MSYFFKNPFDHGPQNGARKLLPVIAHVAAAGGGNAVLGSREINRKVAQLVQDLGRIKPSQVLLIADISEQCICAAKRCSFHAICEHNQSSTEGEVGVWVMLECIWVGKALPRDLWLLVQH